MLQDVSRTCQEPSTTCGDRWMTHEDRRGTCQDHSATPQADSRPPTFTLHSKTMVTTPRDSSTVPGIVEDRTAGLFEGGDVPEDPVRRRHSFRTFTKFSSTERQRFVNRSSRLQDAMSRPDMVLGTWCAILKTTRLLRGPWRSERWHA